MQIIPAIDILNGKVVRLLHGNYLSSTEYGNSPLEMAKHFQSLGFHHLHIIDLGGAKIGKPQIHPFIPDILSLGLTVQVGGGIRTIEDAKTYASLGVKCILSTAALENRDLFFRFQELLGDKLILSLDVIDGKIAVNGWTEKIEKTVDETIRELHLKQVIVTDISKDGTCSGINIELYKNIILNHPAILLYAAGGISSLNNIKELAAIGTAGSVIGKAFYEDHGFRNEVIAFRRSSQLG